MLERIRYNTMNSWNLGNAPAYNLKIHKVIPRELQDKVFEMFECENFYDDINFLISEFAEAHNWEWQAGFNGRSGGYLVLYTGGRKLSESKSICTRCGQRNFRTVEDTGTECGRCHAEARENREMWDVFTSCENIEDDEVPEEVMKAFEQLAESIVETVKENAKNCSVEEETYSIPQTRKVITHA
jgi:ribosomal protein L37E